MSTYVFGAGALTTTTVRIDFDSPAWDARPVNPKKSGGSRAVVLRDRPHTHTHTQS